MFVVNGRFLTQKPTGIHRYAFEVCNAMYKQGVDFVVATPKEIRSDYNVEFKTVKCGSLKTHLWEQLSLPRYLKSIGSPLLVSFSGCGPLNYKNQIITIHDVSHESHPEWFAKNYYRYYHYMIPRIAKKAHAVITVSNYSKGETVRILGVDADKMYVIPCDVPTPIKQAAQKLSQSELAPSDRYILTVSSMDPRKNFVRLVEAFNCIEDKDVKLYIVGMQFKAFNTPDMQKLSGENIVLTGYVDDNKLSELYRNAQFSIYPSLYEGFGLPPLESMTFGCPVIASDIPAIREVNGDALLYINPLDINDITLKMNQLLIDENLRKGLKEKGLKQVRKYSWDRTAKEIVELVSKYE